MESEPEFFQKFNAQRDGIQFRSFMKPDGNHNILSVYPENNKKFLDINGNNVGFFCIDFVTEKSKIINPIQMRALLQKTYEIYVKNKLVQEMPDGNRKFMVSDLKSPNNQIAQSIYDGLMNITKTNSELNVFQINPNQSIFGIINTSRS